MNNDQFSYALGINLAENFKEQGFLNEINFKELAAALEAKASNKSIMSIEESITILNEFLGALNAKKHSGNKEIGASFLAENAKKEGVITLASGLQYEIITEGTGQKPTETSKVTTHYHGTLIDGTVFDSSVQRNQPATFGVNQVIKGWTEALQLMGEGSKWRLFIPYNLAYGDQGAGGDIGPFSTLIFEVELLKIN
jgi:FKBP-type peptidyl-prolyl cis-trans isomerase FklB